MDYEITARELRERQERKEEIVLLDVREHWERDTAAIMPSLHIPMNDVPSHFQELDPEAHIVVYCHHGMRSLSVTDWLRKQGLENVQSMAGGIDLWSREIDTTLPRY